MKAKSRFLGIDDAPFRFSDETVPIVGVVIQAPSYIEGVLTTLAEVDGHDATERIAAMVQRSRYRAGLAAILIDGTAVGGFNVIAIDAVHAAVDRPVVTVTRKKPNLGSIEAAANLSPEGKREEGANPAQRLELRAGLVRAAHQDDGPPRGLCGTHEVLDADTPHDRVAHEEGFDRSRLDGFGDLGRPVCARPVRRDRLQQRLDQPRLVSDPAIPEHLRADARLERLLDPLHPGAGRAMRVDFRSEGWLPGFQVVEEGVAREPGSDEDERLPDFRRAQLREDLVEVRGPRVSGWKHLAVTRRSNDREFSNAILPELGHERFFVVQRKEGDERLLRRGNGLVDPSQLVRSPRLDDGDHLVDRDVQRVMPSQVLRSLDDDARDAQTVGEGLELDAFHAEG